MVLMKLIMKHFMLEKIWAVIGEIVMQKKMNHISVIIKENLVAILIIRLLELVILFSFKLMVAEWFNHMLIWIAMI